MIFFISVFALIGLIVQISYIIMFYIGLKNGDANTVVGNYDKRVSVIVAARNEAKNISALLECLANQTYPKNLYEVIIANDMSTDETAQIVNNYNKKYPNIKLINVKGREKAISPKKNALTQGIAASNGEIILSTDADCIVGNEWIGSMVSQFDEGTSMVAGFSQIAHKDWQKASLSQKFECVDFAILLITAAGAISYGKYFSCSGANLSYRKKAFYHVGGFEKIKHLLSGDDVNLMQLMRKANLKVKFAFNPKTFVITKPIQNWRQLLNQRTRWASNSKWQLILNPEFFFYLTAVFVMISFGLILLFLDWRLGFAIFAAKYVFEFMFVKFGFEKFQLDKERLRFFPVWFVIQPFYIITVAIMGIFNLFYWHGKR